MAGTARDRGTLKSWALVLKVLQAPEDAMITNLIPLAPAELVAFLDACRWNREALAYHSGLLDDLPDGLSAPRCCGIEHRGQAAWLWLEEVAATNASRWTIAGSGLRRDAQRGPPRHTAVRALGLTAAVALALFARAPLGGVVLAPLAIIGAIFYAEAVWNSSRVPRLADPAYQARLQALTSLVFTPGPAVGVLWAGPAIDRWGHTVLVGAAVALGVLSLITAVVATSLRPAFAASPLRLEPK